MSVAEQVTLLRPGAETEVVLQPAVLIPDAAGVVPSLAFAAAIAAGSPSSTVPSGPLPLTVGASVGAVVSTRTVMLVEGFVVLPAWSVAVQATVWMPLPRGESSRVLPVPACWS